MVKMDKFEAWDFLVVNNIATNDELELITDVAGFTFDTMCLVLDSKVGFRDFNQYKDYHLEMDDIEISYDSIEIDFDKVGSLEGLMYVLEQDDYYIRYVDTWYIQCTHSGGWYEVERKFHYSDVLSGIVRFYLIDDDEQLTVLNEWYT